MRLPGARWPEAGIYDGIDCNSPLHWDGAGQLYLFASVQHPFRSQGESLAALIEKRELPLDTVIHSEFELQGRQVQKISRGRLRGVGGWNA